MELETVATNEIKILDVHLLKLNRLLDSSIYKLLCLIESNTLNETTLLFTYSLKMIIQEMWERDKTWSFSAF
jgi:hypothetical protein